MYFYYKMYTICTLFYNTFISLRGVMYITTLRSLTSCLQLTPVIQKLWFIYRFIRTTLSLL